MRFPVKRPEDAIAFLDFVFPVIKREPTPDPYADQRHVNLPGICMRPGCGQPRGIGPKGGESVLCQSHTDEVVAGKAKAPPIRQSLDYQSVGRRTLLVDSLPTDQTQEGSTGFAAIDNVTEGLQPGELFMIGGRTTPKTWTSDEARAEIVRLIEVERKDPPGTMTPDEWFSTLLEFQERALAQQVSPRIQLFSFLAQVTGARSPEYRGGPV